MLPRQTVDISENDILEYDKELLEILLRDHTTGRNIIWATDMYERKDVSGYGFYDQIEISKITGNDNVLVVRPRVKKTQEEQEFRSKDKAEVFTPAWTCNHQNNDIDREWFGTEPPFNKEVNQGWIPNTDKIILSKQQWQDYISARRIEMACGEAPYIASRFDVTTGLKIPVKSRIGLLDRKLRLINDNIPDERTDYNITSWRLAALKAISSTYGFEWQGDNLLLAREAILLTYIEYYEDKWGSKPKSSALKKVAEVISWNFWQMDGLKCGIPGYDPQEVIMFGQVSNTETKPEERYCRFMEWTFLKPLRGNELIFRILTDD